MISRNNPFRRTRSLNRFIAMAAAVAFVAIQTTGCMPSGEESSQTTAGEFSEETAELSTVNVTVVDSDNTSHSASGSYDEMVGPALQEIPGLLADGVETTDPSAILTARQPA